MSLEAAGIVVLGAEQHVLPADEEIDEVAFDNMELDPDVGAVIFSLDNSFTHQKLLLASLYIREKGVPLIVTNDDTVD